MGTGGPGAGAQADLLPGLLEESDEADTDDLLLYFAPSFLTRLSTTVEGGQAGKGVSSEGSPENLASSSAPGAVLRRVLTAGGSKRHNQQQAQGSPGGSRSGSVGGLTPS